MVLSSLVYFLLLIPELLFYCSILDIQCDVSFRCATQGFLNALLPGVAATCHHPASAAARPLTVTLCCALSPRDSASFPHLPRLHPFRDPLPSPLTSGNHPFSVFTGLFLLCSFALLYFLDSTCK